MFGIWRHDPDSRGGGNIRQSFVPANVRVSPQQSCKNCRAKKLKTGCSRCKTLNSIIRYAKPGDNGKCRRKPQNSKKSNSDQDWMLDGINADAGPESYECPPETPTVENWTMPMGMDFEDHQDKIIQEPLPQYNTPDHTPQTNTISTDTDFDSSRQTPPLQTTNPLSTVLSDEIDISSWIRSPVSLGDTGPDLTGLPDAETREDPEAATTSSLPTSHITTPGSSRNLSNNFIQAETSPNTGNPRELNLSIDNTNNIPSLQCSCLARVVLLLDELESPSDNPESITSLHSLDSILASIKETLSHAGAMLLCSLCTSKMENMTILAFLFSNLASTCQIIAEKYPHDSNLTQFHHRSFSAYGRYDWPPLPRSTPSRVSDPGPQEGPDDYFHAYGFGGNREGDVRETCVGEYEVDTPQEWRALMRALASLQLQQLDSMMQVMKTVPIVAGCKSLLRRLTTAEGKLTGVKQRIQKRNAEL